MSIAAYPHIEFDSSGIPRLAGSQTKVVEIALDFLAHHWDAAEIRRQHPHLSLGQIHSALAYYFDHQELMDREIEAEIDLIGDLREQAGPSPVLAKLQRLGRLP